MSVVKEPLGVMPRIIWLEIRARDLARAIYEYTAAGDMRTPREEGWPEELAVLLRTIRAEVAP